MAGISRNMGTACCSSKSHHKALTHHSPRASSASDSKPAATEAQDLLGFIDDLFAFHPTKSSAESLRAAASRLSEHLENFPEDRKNCLKLLQSKTHTLLRQSSWTPKDSFDIRVAIQTIGDLIGHYPLQFVSLAYSIAGELVQRKEFADMRETLYETLKKSAIGELEEIGLITVKFLDGLIRFCKEHPEKVTPSDIHQVHNMVTVALSPHEVNPKHEKWYALTDYLLDRLLTDVRAGKQELVQEERELLGSLCREMISSERSTHFVCSKMLDLIEEQKAWEKFADASLGVLVEAVLSAKERYASQLLRILLMFLQTMLEGESSSSNVLELVRFIVGFLKQLKDPVPTINYMAVLQTVVLKLFDHTEMESAAGNLLKMWCSKTDIQSCIRFLHDLTKSFSGDPHAPACASHLKKCIRPRILRDWDMTIFNENWNQLLSVLLHSCSHTHHTLTFQLVDFLMTLLGRKMRVRVHDVQLLNKAAIDVLRAGSDELTRDWFKTCKYCCQIWLCLAAMKNSTLLSGLLKVAAALQTLTSEVQSAPVQVTLSVLRLVLLHAIGTHHGVNGLLDFVDESCQAMQKANVYPDLFTHKKWEEIDDCSLCLFRKGEFPQFASQSSAVELPATPLRQSLTEAVLSREISMSFLRDNLDPLETVESIESSVCLRSETAEFTPVNVEDVMPELRQSETFSTKALFELARKGTEGRDDGLGASATE